MPQTSINSVTSILNINEPVVKILFEPIFTLMEDINNVSQRRRTKRHAIHAILLIISMAIGVFLPYLLPAYGNWLIMVAQTLKIPNLFLYVFQISASIWILATPISWLINKLFDFINVIKFGDTKYFLTTDRAEELAQYEQIKDLENSTTIDREILNEAINRIESIFKFIVSNLRFHDIKKITTTDKIASYNQQLDQIMFGNNDNALKIIDLYEQQYRIERWKDGHTDDLWSSNKLQEIINLFKIQSIDVTENFIEEALKFCYAGLTANKSMPHGRSEDFAEIIELIYDGNIEGINRFQNQQTLLLNQYKELNKQRKENERFCCKYAQYDIIYST